VCATDAISIAVSIPSTSQLILHQEVWLQCTLLLITLHTA